MFKIEPIYFIFRLFYLEFKKVYPEYYFDELSHVLTKLDKSPISDEFLLSICCRFLYSSKKRFEFCQHFIRYCKNFVDKN